MTLAIALAGASLIQDKKKDSEMTSSFEEDSSEFLSKLTENEDSSRSKRFALPSPVCNGGVLECAILWSETFAFR